MNPVHYAAMIFDGRWKVVGKGLRWGDYPTLEAALTAARRMARESHGLGLEVQLHVHEDTGLLHRVDAADDERAGEIPAYRPAEMAPTSRRLSPHPFGRIPGDLRITSNSSHAQGRPAPP